MHHGTGQEYYQHDIPRCPSFFYKTEEDESHFDEVKSEELGYPVPKMVDYIYVNPQGQKGGPSQFYATDFIERKKKESHLGLGWLPEWVRHLEEAYAAFKKGSVLPVNGTPLVTYQRIAKKRREQLAQIYPTVEDLAAVPDSSLFEIGLDGRVLRDMARDDIRAKQSLSPVVKDLANANETIRRQEELLASLASRLEALESKPSKRQSKIEERADAIEE